jgi:uncharacterized membrane protein YphA (DoxX/SURF4 family)
VTDNTLELRNSGNLRFANWLFRFAYASVLWLAVRVWLGYQWLNAGYQKIWGSEKMGFCQRRSKTDPLPPVEN